jgi:hypothetical protein
MSKKMNTLTMKKFILLSLLVPLIYAWPGSKKVPYSKDDNREITPEELQVLENELPPEIPKVKQPSGDSSLFAKKGDEQVNL